MIDIDEEPPISDLEFECQVRRHMYEEIGKRAAAGIYEMPPPPPGLRLGFQSFCSTVFSTVGQYSYESNFTNTSLKRGVF